MNASAKETEVDRLERLNAERVTARVAQLGIKVGDEVRVHFAPDQPLWVKRFLKHSVVLVDQNGAVVLNADPDDIRNVEGEK